jgi:hypothetical protein
MLKMMFEHIKILVLKNRKGLDSILIAAGSRSHIYPEPFGTTSWERLPAAIP